MNRVVSHSRPLTANDLTHSYIFLNGKANQFLHFKISLLVMQSITQSVKIDNVVWSVENFAQNNPAVIGARHLGLEDYKSLVTNGEAFGVHNT